MINPFQDVNWKPGRGDLGKFSRSLMVGVPLMAGAWLLLVRWHGRGWPWQHAAVLAAVGAGSGLLFWLVPVLARPFYFAWYFLACCIGVVLGNLFLAIVYGLFFTGLGQLSRAFGRRAIQKTPDRTAPTYWRPASPSRDARSYYNQF